MPFEDDLRRYFERHARAPVPAILATRLLMRAATMLGAHIEAALNGEGITMRGYLALSSISLHKGEALRPSDLSVTLDASRTQVTRLLDTLAEQKLVTRKPSPDDRRALGLALTAAGEHKLARCLPKVHAVYRQAWAGVADLAPVARDLGTLNAGLAARHAAKETARAVTQKATA
jgi:MarR family transcriptional repressor of emrRAB